MLFLRVSILFNSNSFSVWCRLLWTNSWYAPVCWTAARWDLHSLFRSSHISALWQEGLGLRVWGKLPCPAEQAHLPLDRWKRRRGKGKGCCCIRRGWGAQGHADSYGCDVLCQEEQVQQCRERWSLWFAGKAHDLVLIDPRKEVFSYALVVCLHVQDCPNEQVACLCPLTRKITTTIDSW